MTDTEKKELFTLALAVAALIGSKHPGLSIKEIVQHAGVGANEIINPENKKKVKHNEQQGAGNNPRG